MAAPEMEVEGVHAAVEVVVPQSSPEVDTNGLYFTLEEQNI
jgi:hypothetical protein